MIPIIKYDASKTISTRSRSTDQQDYEKVVAEIVNDVKIQGDSALFRYSKEFDHIELNAGTVRVREDEIKELRAETERTNPDFTRIVLRAAERITEFHKRQLQNSWFNTYEHGELMGQLVRPLASCGIYVPGGKAAYPSSVLMNAIPAIVAGVKRIVMATPAPNGKLSPAAITAASLLGITEIYKIGGAQAIAALAFGTDSVPRVDKIVGPGNIYVATAKRMVFGQVSIDSVAGPSEILIIADKTAKPEWIARDLLSQAEHDELASAILVTDDKELADKVAQTVEELCRDIPRKKIIEKSLVDNARIYLAGDMNEAVYISNQFAPEHLELCVANPFGLLPFIENAGSIFLGDYTPEPLGDYMAGPNHVIPTEGTARFFSPLSVDDFIKKSSVLAFSKDALYNIGEDVIKFAETEGLYSHAEALRARMKDIAKQH